MIKDLITNIKNMLNTKLTREQHTKNYTDIISLLKKMYPEYEIGFESLNITPWGEVDLKIGLSGKSSK